MNWLVFGHYESKINVSMTSELELMIILPHLSNSNSAKTISKQYEDHPSTVNKIIQKWKILKIVANLPRSGHHNKFKLGLQKLRLNKLQDFWNSVLCTDETQMETFGHNKQHHIWWKPTTAYQHEHLIKSVIKSTMNHSVYQIIIIWGHLSDS